MTKTAKVFVRYISAIIAIFGGIAFASEALGGDGSVRTAAAIISTLTIPIVGLALLVSTPMILIYLLTPEGKLPEMLVIVSLIVGAAVGAIIGVLLLFAPTFIGNIVSDPDFTIATYLWSLMVCVACAAAWFGHLSD